MPSANWINVAQLADFEDADRKVVSAGDRPVLLLRHDGGFYAVDNRCPHMGFPLDKGSVKDCILTCHWHHARFDLTSGGTFDQFADDVRAYPIELRGDEPVDRPGPAPRRARAPARAPAGWAGARHSPGGRPRPRSRCWIAMATRASRSGPGCCSARATAAAGWGQGLTMLTCFMNMLPQLGSAMTAPRALYHGLTPSASSHSACRRAFRSTRCPMALPICPTLKRWFRQFIEVRDDEGAERCVVSAVRAGASSAEMADMLFAAITDHRYIQIGHPADFANKALEALDIAGWEHGRAGARQPGQRDRKRQSNGGVKRLAQPDRPDRNSGSQLRATPGCGCVWRRRARMPCRSASGMGASRWRSSCSPTTHRRMSTRCWRALRDGATPEQLAGAVAYAAALRIARFHTANEFGDWDTVLHTFTFANAIHQGIRRIVAAAAGSRHARRHARRARAAAAARRVRRGDERVPRPLPEHAARAPAQRRAERHTARGSPGRIPAAARPPAAGQPGRRSSSRATWQPVATKRACWPR